MRRYLALLIAGLFYLSTLVQAAEVRKLGSNDLEWGYGTTTSPAGKVVTKIPYPFAGSGSENATTIDVRSYGALLDGTTDDSAAFTSAMAAVASGGTILIPGTMAVGSVGWSGFLFANKSNITIMGIGDAKIKALNIPTIYTPFNSICTSCSYPVIIFDNCDNMRVEGITFDLNGTYSAALHLHNSTNTRISGNTFSSMNLTDAGLPAISATRGNGNVYSNNLFSYVNIGIIPGVASITTADDRETGTVIIGNTFRNNNHTGIQGTPQYSTITGNVFYDTNTGINVGSNTAFSRYLTITGNIIKNCTEGIRSDITGSLFIEDINITGNVIDNCNTGINPISLKNSIISSNRINARSYGLGSANWDNITISNNIISAVSASSFTGIYLSDSSNIIVDSNHVWGFGEVGIYMVGTPPTPHYFIINNNMSQGNAWGIKINAGFDNVFINNNLLYGNTTFDLRSDSAYPLYGTNNKYSTSQFNGSTQMKYFVGTKSFSYGSAAPTDVTIAANAGDIVWNTGTDNVIGWKCTSAGSPGTWKAMETVMP